jgi:molybdate transport system substrate-binding protein
MRIRPVTGLVSIATVLALAVPAVASPSAVRAAMESETAATAPSPLPGASKPTGSITVSAAASLTDVFPVIARAFQKRYPGTSITFNFAGSSTLVNQAIAGAPVDVLATASESTMWKAVNAGVASRPWIYAKNAMAIAMPADNPASISSLTDLTRPGVLVGVCDIAVPCGAAASELLRINDLSLTPVTRELDVRALLAKVEAGDLDAGIVYVTDIRWAGSRVSSVSIPMRRNVETRYPISTVGQTDNPTLAQAFVNYVRFSESAQGILRAYGFARPW